jgi:hypothetical protein
MDGALPMAASRATAASRSQFDPGKTMTLALMISFSPMRHPGASRDPIFFLVIARLDRAIQ